MDANPPGAYRIEGNPRCWGNGLGGFRFWAEAIDRAWQQGSHHPAHLISDGDGAIASGIELVYGEDAARRLLDAGNLAEGRERARRIMRATAGAARYWCE